MKNSKRRREYEKWKAEYLAAKAVLESHQEHVSPNHPAYRQMLYRMEKARDRMRSYA